jgi:hypothetical protein
MVLLVRFYFRLFSYVSAWEGEKMVLLTDDTLSFCARLPPGTAHGWDGHKFFNSTRDTNLGYPFMNSNDTSDIFGISLASLPTLDQSSFLALTFCGFRFLQRHQRPGISVASSTWNFFLSVNTASY